MTPISKSRRFEEDFARIALDLSEASPRAALKFIDAVEAAIELLGSQPEMGPVWRAGTLSRPTRFILVPGFHNYIIFYRFEAGVVRLGRLLHGARDLRDLLEE